MSIESQFKPVFVFVCVLIFTSKCTTQLFINNNSLYKITFVLEKAFVVINRTSGLDISRSLMFRYSDI